jgi:bifunctional oligoribonuclease and PAP phosphatase NrnA
VNVLSSIEGNNAWVLFIEEEGHQVRIRPKEKDIHTVAKIYNSGGHPLASGAPVLDNGEILSLVRELDELLN